MEYTGTSSQLPMGLKTIDHRAWEPPWTNKERARLLPIESSCCCLYRSGSTAAFTIARFQREVGRKCHADLPCTALFCCAARHQLLKTHRFSPQHCGGSAPETSCEFTLTRNLRVSLSSNYCRILEYAVWYGKNAYNNPSAKQTQHHTVWSFFGCINHASQSRSQIVNTHFASFEVKWDSGHDRPIRS